MPMLDMPLEELKKYKGSTPKPADFDSFWNRALKEMHETNSNPVMIPAEFRSSFADCYDLYFTGVKKARIHAKLLIPKHIEGKAPALLNFHGYAHNSAAWFDKLPFAADGFVVAAMDCRGQGGLSEDTGGVKGNTMHGHIIRGLDGDPDNMLMRNIFLDTAQLAKIVMELPQVDETRVGAYGVSQGGGLSLACASLEPRISRTAVMYPFLNDYKRVWDMDLDEDAYQEIRTYFRYFDPLHERETEIFEKLSYVDVQNLVPRIQGSVMMAITLLDNVCPPSTQFAAYNKIKAKKEAVIFPDFGHDILPGQDDRAYAFLTQLKK